eukprot:CAMPEP_0206428888 /NCGR_PEP_ID=MMETSP0324_2-20121206/5923_1 /ASSEMBLY_ACC=CAM_ASM_000836 /TAXON_ID=2866 /ORGANISM="Crypthecodinium cohnii, Strain Seligo" /LENGTH=114 /DNA_ID=CAMNT_0053894483 /DNA_START=169 /DNA_END=513 /DNA_ORIENTATION=-
MAHHFQLSPCAPSSSRYFLGGARGGVPLFEGPRDRRCRAPCFGLGLEDVAHDAAVLLPAMILVAELVVPGVAPQVTSEAACHIGVSDLVVIVSVVIPIGFLLSGPQSLGSHSMN